MRKQEAKIPCVHTPSQQRKQVQPILSHYHHHHHCHYWSCNRRDVLYFLNAMEKSQILLFQKSNHLSWFHWRKMVYCYISETQPQSFHYIPKGNLGEKKRYLKNLHPRIKQLYLCCLQAGWLGLLSATGTLHGREQGSRHRLSGERKELAGSRSNLALSNQSLNDEGDSDINELVSVEF